MVTLYLLRHAKSSPGGGGLGDKDRPLNERGRGAAAAIGQYLRARGVRPGLTLCSTAQRTRETLDILRAAALWPADAPKTRYLDELYLATPSAILRAVAATPAATDAVLAIGHNPGLHDLALSLAALESEGYPDLLAHFPTGALAVLTSSEATWPRLAAMPLTLSAFVRPRDLPA